MTVKHSGTNATLTVTCELDDRDDRDDSTGMSLTFGHWIVQHYQANVRLIGQETYLFPMWGIFSIFSDH